MIASQIGLVESAQIQGQASPVVHLPSVPNGAIATRGVEMVFQSSAGKFQALKGVDLNINPGEIQLLMGPSGSGKTTFLSIVSGLLSPTAGQVYLLGQDITQMSEAKLSKFRLKNVGFIFQHCNLFPALNATENVELALKLKGVRGRAARLQAQLLLNEVGLGDRLKSLPRDLSGGQKQRVAIARALAGNPPLIVADEPTASLDSQTGQTIVELLRKLAKEGDRTVLMVTHDPRVVHIADRVAYLEDGILADHPPELRLAG